MTTTGKQLKLTMTPPQPSTCGGDDIHDVNGQKAATELLESPQSGLSIKCFWCLGNLGVKCFMCRNTGVLPTGLVVEAALMGLPMTTKAIFTMHIDAVRLTMKAYEELWARYSDQPFV